MFHMTRATATAGRTGPAKRAGSGPVAKIGGASGRVLRVDTIPKPDGLAWPRGGQKSNAVATKAGRCPALFVFGSRVVRCQR